MTQILTANTARSNVSTALVAGISQPYTPKAFPRLVFGETVGVQLYLIDNGSYDARSGDASYTPRIVVTLDDAKPKSGTFTVSDDEATTYTASGAGTSTVNGEFIRTGNSLDGNPAFTLYDSNGNGIYFLFSELNVIWVISSSGIDNTDVAFYWQVSSSSTPPLTGWQVESYGTSPAPTLTQGATSAAIDWDATEVEIESALNAMNNNTGPYTDTVTVEKFGNGAFSILFDSVGAQDVLTVDAGGIQPLSATSVLPIVEGDATTREEQIIKIAAEPLVFTSGGSLITNGWSMTVDANNANFLRAVAAEQGDLSANYSIEVVSSGGAIDVVAKGPVILSPSTYDVAALSGISYPDVITSADVVNERIDITGLTGGTSTDLDSIATVDLAVNYTVLLGVTIGASVPGKTWVLQSGTDAEDPANGIVRPDDYAASTNEKVWRIHQ